MEWDVENYDRCRRTTAAKTRTGLAELGSKDEDVLGSNEKKDSGSEDKDVSQVARMRAMNATKKKT